MKIRGRLKSLVLGLFLPISFFLFADHSFAGTSESTPNFWSMNVGFFGAYYNGDYQYNATWLDNATEQHFSNNAQQQGFSPGSQINIFYHDSRYFFGLGFSAQGNTDHAQIGNIVRSLTATVPVIDAQIALRVAYNLDLTGSLGLDLTPLTHVYGKAGLSYALLREHISFLAAIQRDNHLGEFYQDISRRSLWGYVAGLGIEQDISEHASLFAEYDYYQYGGTSLNMLSDILLHIEGTAAGTVDVYTQNVSTNAYVIRVGLNVNFDV